MSAHPSLAEPIELTADVDRSARGPLVVLGPWLALACMTLAFAVGFSWLSLARHAAFQSHAFDLGNMDQAVWNTLHGHLLRFTDMAVGDRVLTSRLAIHVEPLLLALAPLYLLHSGPETLLVAQAVVVALGAVPAYLLALHLLGRPWLSLVFPLAYLLHPSLQAAVLDDFHPVTLAACFLLCMLYFAWIDSVAGFLVFAALAMATKEDIGLLVACAAIIPLLRGRYRLAAGIVMAGVGWFLTCVLLIIPAHNPSGASPYLARYGYLGHGVGGVLLGAIHHPLEIARLVTSPARLAFLDTLLRPLGYVSLAGFPVFVLALPSLAIDMLSADPHMYSGFYQYPAELVPYVIVSAVAGCALVDRLTAAKSRSPLLPLLLGLVLIASLIDTWRYGSFPLAEGYVVPSTGSHQRLEASALAALPPTATVSAADEIEPHLSDRKSVYLFPTLHPANGPAARFIVLDASIPAKPIEPHTMQAGVVSATRHGYGIVTARDGVLVLEKGVRRRSLPWSFFTFLFGQGTRVSPTRASWGPLTLVGVTVHPRDGRVTRARPAISLETYWRAESRLPPGASIRFYLSPVYTGRHPAFSHRWSQEWDSPAWDWLSLSAWAGKGTIRALSLPLLPDVNVYGKVDVAVGVRGAGTLRLLAGGVPVPGTRNILRLATVQVGY